MVEARRGESSSAAEGMAATTQPPALPESVNVPLMATMNLSSILLDPSLNDNYSSNAAAAELRERQLYSQTLWGDNDKVRNVDDLRREMDEQAEEEYDLLEERDEDFSGDERGEQIGSEEHMATIKKSGHSKMSHLEMTEIIEAQKREIKYLTAKCERQEDEKESIIKSFQESTTMLIERLKDLESQQNLGHERPQTACVLNNIQESSKPQRRGRIGEDKSIDDVQVLNVEAERNSKVLGREKQFVAAEESQDDIECPNCKEMIPGEQAGAHTIQCFRNATKCKICKEVIQRNKKKEHLEAWRDESLLIKNIIDDNEERVNLFFEHGFDVNLKMAAPQHNKRAAIHIAAVNGSLNSILAMIGQGAEVDPVDREGRTPLSLAIEHNKFTCVRGLIELGSNLELTDKYGRTPLMFACALGSKEMAELLIQYKANIHAANNMKETCMSFAQKSKNQDLIMFLVNKGISIRPQSGRMMRPMSGTRRPGMNRTNSRSGIPSQLPPEDGTPGKRPTPQKGLPPRAQQF